MEKTVNRKNKYKIVIDCETCPIDRSITKCDKNNSLAYDIGFAIVDKLGNIYESYSYVVEEIFLGEYDRMKSAYYREKLPRYWYDLGTKERKLESLKNIYNVFIDCIERYHVEECYAHNITFDFYALNNTCKWVSYGNWKSFFPKGIKICDTQLFAHHVICKTPTYRKFCEENGFLTSCNRPQEKAEIIYRYIINDLNFEESHTGLEDVLIEKEILRYCYSKHKKGKRELFTTKY